MSIRTFPTAARATREATRLGCKWTNHTFLVTRAPQGEAWTIAVLTADGRTAFVGRR